MTQKIFMFTVRKYRIRHEVAKQKILDYKIYLAPKESFRKKVIEEIEMYASQIGKKLILNNVGVADEGIVEDICVDFDIAFPEKFSVSLTVNFKGKILYISLDKKTKILKEKIQIGE